MTVNWLELQRRSHEGFTVRLDAVTDWNAPTPDVEWDIRALVHHVIEEQQWVPHLLAGRTVEEARAELVPLDGDDLRAEWSRYSRAAIEAWISVPDDASVHLSGDTVTAPEYLREQVSDVTIHTWDLARATGSDDTLDPALVAASWTIFEPQKATLEASGLYAPAIPLPDDAPLQSRLLALTGRDDRRR